MTADATRWAWAALACSAWLCLLVHPVRQQWRAWRATRRLSAAATAGQPAPLLIAYASQSGFGAQLAEQLAQMLAARGCPAQARTLQSLRAQDLQAAKRMLFIASTTGEGDAPDNAGAFVTRVMPARGRLPGLSYGLLALGDSRYAGFCGFGRTLDAWLRAVGATPAFARIEADGGAAPALDAWVQAVAAFTDTGPAAPVPPPTAAQRWRLGARRILNPGSPGAPIHHLVLDPLDAPLDWQAGDVARVCIPAAPGRDAAWRDYTLASLPHEGQAQLLVRETVRPDGQRGLGSGWLGHDLALGGEVQLQIRRNPVFHGPPVAVPLVLVGNGTGLAGLAVHLKAREHAQQAGQRVGPAWLLFGERTRRSDALFDEALQRWRASGLLQRLDRAFSRDAEAPARYVQDLLAPNADALRFWVTRGAAVYVCGQRDGMAGGVHQALQEVLGEVALARLTADGRYRRDVY